MNTVEQRALTAFKEQFGAQPSVLTSAPGRVNLIGEHTDYNDGFALPCAIDLRVAVALAEGPGALYSADYDELQSTEGCAGDTWAAYPRGVAWALTQSGNEIPRFHGAFAGDVPPGSGLSSSAAMECATALGLDALFGLGLSRKALAVACKTAENGYLSVASGIMDPYASLLCRQDSALYIDCRSLEAFEAPMDLLAANLSLVVCDTRMPRTLRATGYNERHSTCETVARRLGISSLRDATPADLDRLDGVERCRARHVVGENQRVLDAVDALSALDFERFGGLMYASHISLREDYEVSTPELDLFVDTASDTGAVGARLTGAGFGGCAIAFITTEAIDALDAATRSRFLARGYIEPVLYVFRPSDGAHLVSM